MPTLKSFITGLARKAGFDTETDTAKTFFAALPETDVPDDVLKRHLPGPETPAQSLPVNEG